MIYKQQNTDFCRTLAEMRKALNEVGYYHLTFPYVYAFENEEAEKRGDYHHRYHIDQKPNGDVKLTKWNF